MPYRYDSAMLASAGARVIGSYGKSCLPYLMHLESFNKWFDVAFPWLVGAVSEKN